MGESKTEKRAEELLSDCEGHEDRVELLAGILDCIESAKRGLKARIDHLEALEEEEGEETHYDEIDHNQQIIDILEEQT